MISKRKAGLLTGFGRSTQQKDWDRRSVQRLVNRFELTGTMSRQQGSGRPVTATTEDNGALVEQMVCSQEEPSTHKSPQEIAPMIGIS